MSVYGWGVHWEQSIGGKGRAPSALDTVMAAGRQTERVRVMTDMALERQPLP